ncbi:MAG: hypothetical protein EA349_16025 [Halomonadaceae bacterium]|nr:MAG: hypothetical protein EA349_16025 [Halomonadaceae bacterium]
MYQLVFKGECVPGVDQATAKRQAKALFKASEAQVEKMFAGGRVVIRNRLDSATAEKYQGVLRKNGIICRIEPMAEDASASADEVREEAQAPEHTSEAVPAPPVAPEKPKPQSGTPRKTSASGRLPLAGDKVDDILSGTDFTLGAPGERLGESETVEPPLFEHLDDWSLAPPGADLVEPQESIPVATPDISHLSLEDKPANKE